MNSRYQLKTLYAEQDDIKTYEGTDSLTGLPVLVYQFVGRTLPSLMTLESENIPGILASEQDGEMAQVVVAYSKNYRALSVPLQLDTAKLLVGSARALKDAAQAGIIHGDIKPERFLASGDHVLLEGFGLPWQVSDDAFRPPEAASGSSFAGDAYAWAKSLLALTDGQLSPHLKRVLNACLVPDPNERPAASELYSALKTATVTVSEVESEVEEVYVPSEAAPAASQSGLDPIELDYIETEAVTAPPETTENAPDDFMAFFGKTDASKSNRETSGASDFSSPDFNSPAQHPVSEDFSEGFYDEHAEEMRAQAEYAGDAHDEPSMIVSDAGEREPLSSGSPPAVNAAESGGKFIKNLPPGATYHAGETTREVLRPGMFEEYAFDDTPARRSINLRRIILLSLFVIGVGILTFLILRQDFNRIAPALPTSQETVRYPVEVQIGPASLPPVEIVVVQSPTGSRLLPNTVVGRFSPGVNNIVLDRDGIWQLQARFQDRVSDTVTFELPQQRTVALTLPEAPQE